MNTDCREPSIMSNRIVIHFDDTVEKYEHIRHVKSNTLQPRIMVRLKYLIGLSSEYVDGTPELQL